MNDRPLLKRRDFLSKSIAAPAALAAGINSLTYSHPEDAPSSKPYTLNPLVPFQFYPELETEMFSYIRILKERYGFRRFLLTGPSKEYRYIGFPDASVFTGLGKQILHVKEALASLDVEIGWWCATTIRIGKGSFQSIVRADGSIAEEACCPLDPQYSSTFSNYIASVVEIARPFWINFEDDFHLNGGCYCERHLDLLAKRVGRHYTREQLLAAQNEKTSESEKLVRAWGEVCRDSLAGLAAAVRRKVDQIAPETRLCLCESGSSERDGNFTEAVTRAFAGSTRPVVRVHGSSYFSDHSLDIAKTLFNPLFKRQHLPQDFELIHESDTFPHTRFFMSATKLKTLLTGVLAYGLDDSLFYATQYLENPLEEKAYCEMFHKMHRRFDTLKKEVQGGKVTGCEIIQKPAVHSDWVKITGRMGIPHTSANGKVKLLSGNVAAAMSDEEIRSLLKGSLFLDGHAAYILSERGYSQAIGIKVTPRRQTRIPPFYEGIRHPERYDLRNRLMYNYVWAFGNKEKSFYFMQPLVNTEVLTDFMGSDKQPVAAGMTRFINEWGGRIAAMAFSVEDPYVNGRAADIFNYSKQTLLQQVLSWLDQNALPVCISNVPNTFCIFTQSESEQYGLATITGLSADTFNTFTLNLSPEWRQSSFALLEDNGTWKPVDGQRHSNTVEFRLPLAIMDPIVIKITKNL